MKSTIAAQTVLESIDGGWAWKPMLSRSFIDFILFFGSVYIPVLQSDKNRRFSLSEICRKTAILSRMDG